MENRNELQYQELDAAFEKRVKHAVNLREREQIKSFIDQVETQFQSENKADKVVVRSIMGKRWMGIAAALLFMAAAFFTFQNLSGPTPDQLVAEFYEPYPNSYKPIVRSQTQNNDPEVEGLVKYENGLYKEALIDFGLLPEINEHIRIFMAISKLETADLSGAKTDLQMLIDQKGSLYDEAQWYMAMAHAKEGDLNKVKSNLEMISNLPSSEYQKEAKAILEKLK